MSNDRTTWRAFISIEPSPDLRHALGQLRTRHQLPRSVRWTPQNQIHLTLRFLGNIPADATDHITRHLRQACTGIKPFELEAAGFGCFPNARRPRVLWVGLHGEMDALTRLQRRIEEETRPWGRPEEQPFHPHLTVARIKPPAPRQLGALLEKAPRDLIGRWTVTEVNLMRSELTQEGALHTPLQQILL